MANGVYGTGVPSTIQTPNEISNYVDIFYRYSPTRESSDITSTVFKKLDTENLRPSSAESGDGTVSTYIDGLYNLTLPSTIFSRKGFYTIYIKPKEVRATIEDVSTLTDFPQVRGIVLDTTTLSAEVQDDAKKNNGLVGYRVIYLNDDGSRMPEMRIVTSNNKAEPVTAVSTTTNLSTYTYQYNENASLTFVTLTPSMSMSFKANSTPFIGKKLQDILLVNTLFEPVCIEIETVDNDADTLATMIGGSQLRDLNKGLLTTFDENGNIYMQHEFSTLKSTETNTPQYEIKERRIDNIDTTQSLSVL